MKKVIIVALIAIIPGVGFAHGNIFDTTADSVAAAIGTFQNSAEKEVVSGYKGLRAWHSGSKVKVRFYYGDSNDSVLYGCQMEHYEDGTEEIICTEE